MKMIFFIMDKIFCFALNRLLSSSIINNVPLSIQPWAGSAWNIKIIYIDAQYL